MMFVSVCSKLNFILLFIIKYTICLLSDSEKKKRKPLRKFSYWRNFRPSYWQFINSYIPLRVSNFEYRYVNKDRQAKLNSMWKKSSRW